MPKSRAHFRFSRAGVEVDSPLIECRLLNLSTAGLAVETNVGLRLGVPYPFRLRDGEQTLSTEAKVRWCRLVRNNLVEGESRPVFHAGAAFIQWQTLAVEEQGSAFEEQGSALEEQGSAFEEQGSALEEQGSAFEEQVEDTLDQWMTRSRVADPDPGGRLIIHHSRRRRDR